MKHILVAVSLLLPSVAALGHGPAPAAQHGGAVAESSDEHWVELVLKDGDVTVYVSDEANKPVASARLGGKITVLAGGRSQSVTLAPAGANSLAGKLDPPLAGAATSVVSLVVDGKPTQARIATH